MALTADLPTLSRHRVARMVARGYARLGCTVVELLLAEATGLEGVQGVAILVPERGVVECVADEGLMGVARAVRLLAVGGWEVRLLVPGGLAGEAHRLLRGTAARLQPWWAGAGDDVCFGAPEVP